VADLLNTVNGNGTLGGGLVNRVRALEGFDVA